MRLQLNYALVSLPRRPCVALHLLPSDNELQNDDVHTPQVQTVFLRLLQTEGIDFVLSVFQSPHYTSAVLGVVLCCCGAVQGP